MSRTSGARNADYEQARLGLSRNVRKALLQPDGLRLSLRDMAAAAGVSVATLKHYFHDRDGVVKGVIESIAHDGAPRLAAAAQPLKGNVRKSLLTFVKTLCQAWVVFEVGPVQAMSLAAGLSNAQLGAPYVDLVLEPLLQTAEARLTRHIEWRELSPCDTRYAALQLLSPVVLALLHQHSLGGSGCRPLDLDDFCRSHVEAFLRSQPTTAARQPSAKPKAGRRRH